MREEREKANNQLLNLAQQVNILKAATGKMTAEEKKAFEKNINQYIREIDNCIGLLSE